MPKPILLPTSLVGSYPQPDWLIDRQELVKSVVRLRAEHLWLIDREHREAAQDDATILAVRDQERAGLDIVSDGEQARESYSNHFATALDGVDLDKPGRDPEPVRQDDPGAAHCRQDQAQAPGRGSRRETCACEHRSHGKGDRAGRLHHGGAGPG